MTTPTPLTPTRRVLQLADALNEANYLAFLLRGDELATADHHAQARLRTEMGALAEQARRINESAEAYREHAAQEMTNRAFSNTRDLSHGETR